MAKARIADPRQQGVSAQTSFTPSLQRALSVPCRNERFRRLQHLPFPNPQPTLGCASCPALGSRGNSTHPRVPSPSSASCGSIDFDWSFRPEARDARHSAEPSVGRCAQLTARGRRACGTREEPERWNEAARTHSTQRTLT